MKCRICGCEMFVDRAVEKSEEAITEFHYKCPNSQCPDYGYKQAVKEEQ